MDAMGSFMSVGYLQIHRIVHHLIADPDAVATMHIVQPRAAPFDLFDQAVKARSASGEGAA
jgi:hypothetical protein